MLTPISEASHFANQTVNVLARPATRLRKIADSHLIVQSPSIRGVIFGGALL